MKEQARFVSTVLLDFVFGEPLPQPEVIEQDTEKAWLEWLDAIADQESMAEFADTRPMRMQMH